MNEGAGPALLALLVAALPFVGLGLAFAALLLAATAWMGLMELIERPFRYWLLAILVAANAVVLIPLWLASLFVASSDPATWHEARQPVFIFSTVLLLPTGLVWMWARRAKIE